MVGYKIHSIHGETELRCPYCNASKMRFDCYEMHDGDCFSTIRCSECGSTAPAAKNHSKIGLIDALQEQLNFIEEVNFNEKPFENPDACQ